MPKILVVEDYPSNQFFFNYLLGKCGAETLIAEDMASAQKILTLHHDIDVVLIDGALKGGCRGEEIAKFIVEEIWPRQEQAGQERTAFATISSNPYHAAGASAVYAKEEVLELFRAAALAGGGLAAWVREMKEARPKDASRPDGRPQSKGHASTPSA